MTKIPIFINICVCPYLFIKYMQILTNIYYFDIDIGPNPFIVSSSHS